MPATLAVNDMAYVPRDAYRPTPAPAWAGMLCLVFVLIAGTPALASEAHPKTGSVVLRMCKSADRVKALSVMCHSYLDGYLDAAMHYRKGGRPFCLSDADRK